MTELNARAVAILVALRSGPRSDEELSLAIADRAIGETRTMTHSLGSDLACQTARLPGSLIGRRGNDQRWYLTINGVAWLAEQSLDVAAAWRL